MEIQVTNHLLQPGQTSQSPCWFSPWAGTHTAPCKSSFALGACLLGKTGKAALRRGTCSTGKVPETRKWHMELCTSPTHHFIRCRLNRIGSKANVKSWFRLVKHTVLKHLPQKKKKCYLQITVKFSVSIWLGILPPSPLNTVKSKTAIEVPILKVKPAKNAVKPNMAFKWELEFVYKPQTFVSHMSEPIFQDLWKSVNHGL